MMITLVTGHLGFIGSHLMVALRQRGEVVVGIDLKHNDDIRTCSLPHDPDRVYHLAAQTNAQCENAEADASVNIMGTLRLLQRYGSRVVLASSSMVNHPVCPYAISKRACEDYARYYGAAVVRLCNIYGVGGHSAWDRFEGEQQIEIRGSGNQRRTYAPVADAVTALLDARAGHTTLLQGVDLTVNELAARFPDKLIRRVAAVAIDPLDATQVH